MAVHVIPYNPWREQLALTALGNVAGDIIGDMWKAHRQNEQNRKANAFRGQLEQDLQNTTQGNISLMPQEAPTGYNANPWAAAFHQNNRPVEQFDIGASAIGKTPSLQDITRAADSLAATKRFSMLDQKTVNDIRDGMMRNTIGDMFGNAGDITGQMNTLARGAAMGLVAPQVLTAFGPFGQKMAFPYSFGETDIGNSKVITARNEHTGEITPGLIMPVSVSPNIAANNASAEKVANIHAGATRDAANINAQGDYARAQAAIQAKQLEIWQKQYDALKAEIDNDTANLADMNEKNRAVMQGVIAEKKQRLAQLEQRIAGGYQGMTAQGAGTATGNQANSNNVWFSMVGSPEGISIHPHGTFGYNRVDHKHGGIDIVVDEGSDITTRPEMGDTFTVKEARKSNSYGNTIVIESNRKFNGKTVQFRYAHMQDGSLNLKPGQTIKAGDIVGKVGSTGRSSGPHLHFEVIVDGQKVDPSTFFQIYTPNNPTQPQKAPNVSALRDSQATAQGQTQTTAQQPQTSTPSQGTPYLRNPDTGIALSLEEFEQLRDQNHTSADELFRALTDRGYELDNGQQTAQKSPAPNNSQSATASVPADTPKNETRTNWAFSLPGQPNFPQAYSAQDVIGAINSVKNNENPFARPNVQDWHEPLNPAPVAPVSADANPWSYVQENTPNSPAFDLNTPIFRGGRRNQPLPTQTVSDDTRNEPLFTGNAADIIGNFVSGWGLASGDSTAVIPDTRFDGYPDPPDYDPRYSASFSGGIPDGAEYNPQPGAFPDGYYDKNRNNLTPYARRGNPRQDYFSPWQIADFFRWINQFQNNENPFARPNFSYKPRAFPAQTPYPYTGNMAGSLFPSNAYDRMKTDGEYIFLDPRLYGR